MNAQAISLASDVAIIASAAVIAVAAILGVRTWRRELTGKAKFEVAKKVMFLSRKFAVDFQNARSPFTSLGEFQDRPRQQNETAAVSQVLDEWYARSRRLRALIEDLQKFQEAHWEAESILNEATSEHITQTLDVHRKSYAKLSSAISTYFAVRQDEADSSSQYQDQDFLHGLHKVIYLVGTDSLTEKVDEATATLGSALRVYVK